jgi:hypothetical protein
VHTPKTEVSSGTPFSISVKIINIDTADKVLIELRNSSNKWRTIQMQQTSAYDYFAQVPAEILTAGLINYRIIIRKKIMNIMLSRRL